MPDSHENRLSFEFHCRYYDNGVDHDHANAILFAMHGQGQLAKYFIRKFEGLKQLGIRVIAPEGLSRYYLDGTSGRVGATWMTSEDRLSDIENYLAFLNEVYEIEVVSKGFNHPIYMLGFSQGAATISRWISQAGIKFETLVLWAGLFPPDLNWDISSDILKDKKIYFVYGKNDPYLTDSRFKEQEELSNQLGVNPEMIEYEGGHSIDPSTLQQIFS